MSFKLSPANFTDTLDSLFDFEGDEAAAACDRIRYWPDFWPVATARQSTGRQAFEFARLGIRGSERGERIRGKVLVFSQKTGS